MLRFPSANCGTSDLNMNLGERNCKRDQQRLFVAVCFARDY